MNNEITTEEQILIAAEEVFLTKGYDATSVADISERAGCNRALIYYYFRTKDNLFEKVYINKINYILDKVEVIVKDSRNLKELLEKFVGLYFDILNKAPKLPMFVINEILVRKKNQDLFINNFVNNPKFNSLYEGYAKLLDEAIDKGEVRQIEPLHLFMDTLSLILFTYISLEIGSNILKFKDNDCSDFLEKRHQEIITLLWNGLKKE